MAAAGADMPERIRGLVAREIAGFATAERGARMTLSDFRAALVPPAEVEVQFSGGVIGPGWTVTRPNGPYRVLFLPQAGVFSLCVEGPFGPLDIGVHGPAIDCFRSV